MPDSFEVNLHRFNGGCAFSFLVLATAREMFGKSYFSLGQGERAAVETASFALAASGFQTLTPQYFANLQPGPQGTAGFQPAQQQTPPAASQATGPERRTP